MLTILISAVFAVFAAVLVLLGVVVAGIRAEAPGRELASQAPGPLSAIVRHLLGLYVRKPGDRASQTGTLPDQPLARCGSDRPVRGGTR
jgi:hypothetical protein